jgi:mRNA interferase RelE/StbE
VKTEFNRYFLKDIGKLPTAELKNEVADIILAVEAAASFSEIRHVKKLKGFKTAYRIRVGDFRIGLLVTQQTVEFVRVVNRKDIYKLFP